METLQILCIFPIYHETIIMSNLVRRRKVIFVIFLVLSIIVIIEMVVLFNRYRELFYLETFLPKPSLPPQYRPISNLHSTKSRILCLISTSPQFHKSRAVHVAATWARHCTKAIFLTSEEDNSLPSSLVIPEAPGYSDLWTKISMGFHWVYKENLMVAYKCDWVIKADDDTFIIIENLMKALSSLDPNESIAAGQRLLTWNRNTEYLNGGAGYVLSRRALKDFVALGLRQKLCENELPLGTEEDVNMSLCLQYLGVKFVDLKDSEGRSLFHIFPPIEELDPRESTRWKHLYLKKLSTNPYLFGFAELSDHPVSFHYVDAETMYLLYYLIYYAPPERNLN